MIGRRTKSLPSLPLLQETMTESGSDRLMLFHQPFINQVAANVPDADILLGKPLPVTAAATSLMVTIVTVERSATMAAREMILWRAFNSMPPSF